MILVSPSETEKLQFIYNWLNIGTFQTKSHKIYFTYQHSQPLYDVTRKGIAYLYIVQAVNIEI